MQAYDQAVVSASKIISQAITSDLNCVTDNGLELDDLITDISRRINHQVTQQTMEAASLRLSSLCAQQGWHPLRCLSIVLRKCVNNTSPLHHCRVE